MTYHQPTVKKHPLSVLVKRAECSRSSQKLPQSPPTIPHFWMIFNIMPKRPTKRTKDSPLPPEGKMSRTPLSFKRTPTQGPVTTIQTRKPFWTDHTVDSR